MHGLGIKEPKSATVIGLPHLWVCVPAQGKSGYGFRCRGYGGGVEASVKNVSTKDSGLQAIRELGRVLA